MGAKNDSKGGRGDCCHWSNCSSSWEADDGSPLQRQPRGCSHSRWQGTSDRRESTASMSSSTVASESRVGTRVRTDPEWIRTQLLLTTGTLHSSLRTTGHRNWTVGHGWRIGRFETRSTLSLNQDRSYKLSSFYSIL